MDLDFKKQYPKDWVVIQNRVVECFKNMTLDEKRLFIIATPLARTTNVSSNDAIFISSSEYARECGIDLSTAYTALETATNKIFTRFFGYTSSNGDRVQVRWVNKVIYLAKQGGTKLYFTDEVLLLLREFDALNPYTKYKKEVVLRLKKDYSLDFYHLAKKHQNMGGFQITLEELFKQFGLPESYKRIDNLKNRVIKPSLDEITKNTDINLSYENIKRGRTVVGFHFFVQEKPQQEKLEMRTPKLTEKQINLFARKLAYDDSFSSKYAEPGEDYDDVEKRLIQKLADPDFVLKHMNTLEAHGFKWKS